MGSRLKRGDVVWVSLPAIGTRGNIQSGRRPSILLNASDTLAKIPTAIVVPGTSKLAAARYPNTLRVTPDTSNGLRVDTVFLAFQIQAVDPSWIQTPRLGQLSSTHLEMLEDVVLDALGFDPPEGP